MESTDPDLFTDPKRYLLLLSEAVSFKSVPIKLDPSAILHNVTEKISLLTNE